MKLGSRNRLLDKLELSRKVRKSHGIPRCRVEDILWNTVSFGDEEGGEEPSTPLHFPKR
jgi:hypothetical protein